MTYRVLISTRAERNLAKLPKPIWVRLDAAIQSLEDDPRPHGAVKMAGKEGFQRIRVGDYRVIYVIRDQRILVLVVRVGHRREVYR
ncbi:MAG: hypothetical protein BIFFINMI_01315 [Phycisphaerae bacterium]|nr:hypothetical protein [Phycisphaerae bacterium]